MKILTDNKIQEIIYALPVGEDIDASSFRFARAVEAAVFEELRKLIEVKSE